MLEAIEKLLILQDRDRKIRQVRGELAHIEPERQALKTKGNQAQTALETAKNKLRQNESDRKTLELEIEAKKELIIRYANQQLQTRKNEEYRALTHQIDTCKGEIFQIENREIELMEQAEAAQKELARASQAAEEARKLVESQLSQLAGREKS
ncbi:MAG TPA: hypothetical protein VNZ22_10190, partial [Bacillota bacterium]|nr:hypothetical protein [Bacillota bacterium]